MAKNDLVSQVVSLWKQGRTIEQIQEQLKIVIEIDEEENNISESIIKGNFLIKALLLS